MDISEENILKLMHRKTDRPMKFSELAKKLGAPEHQRREFRAAIKGMVADGGFLPREQFHI